MGCPCNLALSGTFIDSNDRLCHQPCVKSVNGGFDATLWAFRMHDTSLLLRLSRFLGFSLPWSIPIGRLALRAHLGVVLLVARQPLMATPLAAVAPELHLSAWTADHMPNRNIRQGYEHWCLTAMYPIGIYLIGTQRAAPCPTSLARENSTACRSRPWQGSSSAASSGWCRRRAVAAALRGLSRSARAALHLPRSRDERRQVQAHLTQSSTPCGARATMAPPSSAKSMATQRPARKTYRQNWRAYNAAQTHEKAKFQELLSELCTDIKEPVRLPQWAASSSAP